MCRNLALVLLVCVPGLQKENKVVAHISVLLTLLILIALVMPLMGALGREDNKAVIRVSIMIFATAVALISFIRSFIEARKMRETAENLENEDV